MKLKLIALASLMAFGAAAHAQSNVTLSGKLGFAYKSSKEFSTGAKTTGLGVTDGDFVISAKEDLGGGLSMTASMAVQSRGRTTAIEGRDASLTLSGGFGSVMIGAVEAGNQLIGLASAGAPTIGLDGTNTLDNGFDNVDILRYTAPAFSGATFYVSMMDFNGTALGSAGTGGMQKSSGTSDGKQIGLDYEIGALNLNFDYVDLSKNAPTVDLDNNYDGKRTAVSASYDFGTFVVGAGYQTFKYKGEGKDKQTLVGVSVPLGAFTIGATYGTNDKYVSPNKIKGTEVGVNYDFSKRTAIQVAYQSEKQKGEIKGSTTRVRLMHSF